MGRFDLPKWVVVGASFTDETPPDVDQHHRWHVRGIVDGRAVVRRWARGRWHYEIWPALRFTDGWKLTDINCA